MSDLLRSVINAHGGTNRWQEVGAIDVTFNFWGALLDLKGFPGHFLPIASIDAHTPRTTFLHLDRESENRWIFTPDRVWIERPDGSVVAERNQPRAAFAGHVRETPWDELHLTYFAGYAVWNYLTIPFIFSEPGFSTRELEPHTENGETWRRLEVTHPDHFPTHTKVQTFYFGEDFLLRRMDYVADVVSGVAAHYTYDMKTVEGITFPHFRRVVRRSPDGRALISGPTSFVLDYTQLHIRNR
ncbi:hypothetical protein [Actinacidiphila sp. bgisy160]|uniref:hypothetical protein n=1 Tax=Actinacidiphila sp. bgisy160 TaxID=3413796 RepID=UPI003D70345A